MRPEDQKNQSDIADMNKSLININDNNCNEITMMMIDHIHASRRVGKRMAAHTHTHTHMKV